jgi:hypothetical protein
MKPFRIQFSVVRSLLQAHVCSAIIPHNSHIILWPFGHPCDDISAHVPFLFQLRPSHTRATVGTSSDTLGKSHASLLAMQQRRFTKRLQSTQHASPLLLVHCCAQAPGSHVQSDLWPSRRNRRWNFTDGNKHCHASGFGWLDGPRNLVKLCAAAFTGK